MKLLIFVLILILIITFILFLNWNTEQFTGGDDSDRKVKFDKFVEVRTYDKNDGEYVDGYKRL